MIKTLTGGSVIAYGPTLPAANSTFDGTLFYKTTGADQGLYFFGFSQDANPAMIGDQSAQSWTQVQSPGLYVDVSGDIMTGDLGMSNGTLTISTNNISTVNPALPFTITNSADTIWKKAAVAGGTELMRLTSGGVLLIGGNNTVWHSGNDGAGSGLDADLLDGQSSAFFQNASNINTGTIDIARLPFMPIQQGGGANQGTNKINIGWSTSQLLLQVDSTNFGNVWPISVTGNAATANYANSAGTAASATFATSAGSAGAVDWSTVMNRPSSLSAFTNDTGFVTAATGANSFLPRANNTWLTSADSVPRLFFAANGATSFSATGGFNFFANGTGTATTNLDTAGNFVTIGDVTAFGTVTTLSDERIKTNIELIPNALEKVMSLRGVTYTRTDTKAQETGVIAQDVQKVLPEAVKVQNFDKLLSVAYGNMVGLLIESIKELNGQVEELKAEVAKLKGASSS